MRKFFTALWLLNVSFSTFAEGIRLGDVFARFEEAGYSFVYTTVLVDESRQVMWDGRLSISSLRLLLETQDLSLKRLRGNQWSVQKRQPDPITAPAPVEDPDFRPIDHIVVTASRYEMQGSETNARHKIGAADLADNPSFGGDALRIVHRLPGAATIGVTARPNVRGGSEDELLVLFDGVELIEPFHLRDFQSMFSSFNPQTIQSVEFFTGGFPARYGNRMSGVLDIATQDAFDAPGGELAISAYNLSALYYNESDKDRWLVSARRGNLDLVLQSGIGDPKYHDVYGRYTHEISSGRLKANVFVFDDDIIFTGDESLAKSNVKNRYVWFEWERDKPNRHSRTIVSVGHIDSARFGSTFAEDDSEGILRDNQNIRTVSLKHLQELKISDTLRFDLGGTWRQQSIEYDTLVQVEKDVIAEFLGQDQEIDFAFKQKFSGFSASIFSTVKYRVQPRVALELGLRVDRQTFGYRDTQFSPRIAVLFNPSPQWDLRLSYGKFHQPHAIYELKTADRETSYFKPQSSNHYIAATEYRFSNGYRFLAEVFYKTVDNLKPRYVNLFDPYTYVPELQQDRITVAASKARVKGLELSFLGGTEHFEWNFNYTYSEAQDRDTAKWIDRRWDQTHNINLFLNWTSGPWTIGVATAWHSGWATTVLPNSLPAEQALVIPDFRNNARLKDYGTLDFKVTYEQPLPNSTMQYFFEMTNVINRANKGGVDYEISQEADNYQLDEFDVQPTFPLVTNLGLIWRF